MIHEKKSEMRNEQNNLILKDVHIPGGRIADLTITDGFVSHVGSAERGDVEIICRHKTVLPAGTDLHVHMRDGIQKAKETWESGTKSALAGGVTVVVDQPNTLPPLTTPERIKTRVKLAQSQAYCRFAINGAVTRESDLSGIWQAGIFAFGETFAGPSSYGEAVDADLLSRAMDQISMWNAIMTIHAEQVIEGADSSLFYHDALRPVSGEVQAVQDVLKINENRCRLYFCHLSSGQAIDAVPTGAAMIEVTPHHLFLSHEQFISDDTNGKVNPPLRSESVRKDLFSRWNRIDVIGSDHAPHTRDEKEQPFESAPSGIPGVETMIPLLMGWAKEKKISLSDIIQKTSTRPSEILGICPAGYSPGNRADFAIYPDEGTVICADTLHNTAGWTPYEGMNAMFPEQTILGGEVVFNAGEFFKPELNNTEEGRRDNTESKKISSLWIPGRGYTLKEHTLV